MLRVRTLRFLLAGALTLLLSGLGAAQAMPTAPLPSAVAHQGIVTAQYLRYLNYPNRRFNQGRRAGHYRCGRHGLSTHLECRACC